MVSSQNRLEACAASPGGIILHGQIVHGQALRYSPPADQSSASFAVKSLPTLLLFGKDGKSLYRTEAIAPDEQAKLESLIL